MLKYKLLIFELQYRDNITLLLISIKWIFVEILYLIKVTIWLIIDIIARFSAKLNFKIVLYLNIKYKKFLIRIIPRILDQPNFIKLLNIWIIKSIITNIMLKYNRYMKNDISYLTLATIKDEMIANYLTIDQKYNIVKYGVPTIISKNDQKYYFIKYKYYLLNKNKLNIEGPPIYINRLNGQNIFLKIFFENVY